MPISARKLAANRANAQKSTGPRCPESKEKVALNAVKHGLCGRFKVLSCEDQSEYDDLLRRFMEAEKPVDDVERELVAKMARHTWLSERAIRFQEGCFLVQPQSPEEEAANRDGIAVRKDLDNYLRYQTCHDRAYARAAAELARRRKERQLSESRFDSQQRARAAEARREKHSNHRDELHHWRVAGAQANAEFANLRLQRAKHAAAAHSHGPQLVKEEVTAA